MYMQLLWIVYPYIKSRLTATNSTAVYRLTDQQNTNYNERHESANPQCIVATRKLRTSTFSSE